VKTSDKAIMMGVVAFGLLLAFYFLMLSPKRNTASALKDEVAQLQAQIDEQEQTAAFAEQARAEFPEHYGQLVVLGKAVPEAADTASMLVQMSSISDRADVHLNGIKLSEGGASGAAEPPPTPPPAEGGAEGGEEGSEDSSTPAAATPAPATEAVAASLPIGASVGPAGLPILPYELDFLGGFYEVGDFIGGIDSLVHMSGDQVAVDGRLMTIDGFALSGGAPGSSPELVGKFAVTTYVTPAEQGLTLGATPSAPAPATPQTTPASSVAP
jgi:Tfp pilus assembly protein PilO